jgi:hypothetical protein
MAVLVPKAQIAANLSAIQTASLKALTVRLLHDQLPEDPETPLTALVAAEATFGGYAPKTAVALTGPVVIPGETPELISPLLTWTYGGVAPSGIMYGYFVVDATGAILYWWENFPTPIPLAANLDTCSFVAKYNMPEPTSLVEVLD